MEVVHAVKERLSKITPLLPSDIKTIIIRDQSRFIEASIEEVKFHLILAGIAIRLSLKVESVREATLAEIGAGTCGSGFFKLQTSSDVVSGNSTLH